LNLDFIKILNFINFNDIGLNTLYEVNSFKKTKVFTKTSGMALNNNTSFFNNIYNSYISKFQSLNQSYLSTNYGLKRQHNYLINQLTTNGTTSFNNNSAKKFINYNLQYDLKVKKNLLTSSNSFLFVAVVIETLFPFLLTIYSSR